MQRTSSLPLSFVALVLLAGLSRNAASQSVAAVLDGTSNADLFGDALCSLADLDGDGCSEYAVGARLADPLGRHDAGSVTLYSGRTATALWTLDGARAGDRLGSALARVKDVDGDGLDDLVVGVPQTAAAAPNPGVVLLVSGHDGHVVWSAAGSGDGGLFGASVAGIEDVNGDQRWEVLVGAPLDARGGAVNGAAIVLSGAGGVTLWAGVGMAKGDLFGGSVARAGDLDGDGAGDFVVGAPGFDPQPGVVDDAGAVVAFSGRGFKYLWSSNGSADDQQVGYALSALGDVAGSPRPELLAGAPGDRTNGPAAGAVRILDGGDGHLVRALPGAAAGDEFGHSVAGLADLDADGFADFAVGAPNADPGGIGSAGRVVTCSGRNGSEFFRYELGAGDHSFLGSSVADAGDMNGDGFQDLIFGELRAHVAGARPGRVTVICQFRATWSNYGAGWPGFTGVPELKAGNDPVIGEPFTLIVGGSAANPGFGLLLAGPAEASIPTTRGGSLLVDVSVSQLLWLFPGANPIFGAIPDDPALCGVSIYQQVLEVDPAATKGLSFTPGLELGLGYAYP